MSEDLIAALKLYVDKPLIREAITALRAADARTEAAEARVEEARGLLAPLAEAFAVVGSPQAPSDNTDPATFIDQLVRMRAHLGAAHFRRAAAFLAKLEGETP